MNTENTMTAQENDHKWYIINTVIGQERKIAKTLKEEIEKHSIQELISDVIVPAEKMVEVRRGKKVNVEKKACPGYIFLHMQMNERTLRVIRSIVGVTKFLGRDRKPVAIPECEVKKMLDYLDDVSATNSENSGKEFHTVGDIVKVTEGAFEGFSAVVEAVDNEKMRMKVSVSIFGRETLVELDFKQASKNDET